MQGMLKLSLPWSNVYTLLSILFIIFAAKGFLDIVGTVHKMKYWPTNYICGFILGMMLGWVLPNGGMDEPYIYIPIALLIILQRVLK